MKKLIALLLCALVACTALAISAFAADTVYLSSSVEGATNKENEGLTAAKPKRTLGKTDGDGCIGALKNGGKIVVVGKYQLGANYTMEANGPITITANDGKKDYKDFEPERNPAGGSFKMVSGTDLRVACDLTFDDVILFQEFDQNTIRVLSGGKLTITESVACRSIKDFYMNIVVEAGGKADIRGGTFSSISGDGDIKIGKGVVVQDQATASARREVKLTIGKKTAYVDGKAQTLDVAPEITDGRTLMPLRFIAEALGADVAWDAAAGAATLSADGIRVKITLGSRIAFINGKAQTLDVPAASKNGRTLLPVRFIAEALGATVAWDAATSTATLTK